MVRRGGGNPWVVGGGWWMVALSVMMADAERAGRRWILMTVVRKDIRNETGRHPLSPQAQSIHALHALVDSPNLICQYTLSMLWWTVLT